MVARVEELTQEALSLPLDDRAKVASALLASLDDPAHDPAEAHEAWTAEIRSRIDDIRSGRVKTVPLEQVKAELAERRASRQR